MSNVTAAQALAFEGVLAQCKDRLQDLMDRIDQLSLNADRAGNHHLADKYNEMYADLSLELRLLRREEIGLIDSSTEMQEVITGLSAAIDQMDDEMDRMRDLASALRLVARVTETINKAASSIRA